MIAPSTTYKSPGVRRRETVTAILSFVDLLLASEFPVAIDEVQFGIDENGRQNTGVLQVLRRRGLIAECGTKGHPLCDREIPRWMAVDRRGLSDLRDELKSEVSSPPKRRGRPAKEKSRPAATGV